MMASEYFFSATYRSPLATNFRFATSGSVEHEATLRMATDSMTQPHRIFMCLSTDDVKQAALPRNRKLISSIEIMVCAELASVRLVRKPTMGRQKTEASNKPAPRSVFMSSCRGYGES